MSTKRTSYYGAMYDDKQSKVHLNKIVNNIKAEVEFNILTGAVLPFKLYEKIPSTMSSNDTTYITKELAACGVVLNLSEMIVEELL